MRDRQDGDALPQRLERGQYGRLRVRIQSGRRFVQDEKDWLLHECSGNGEPLTLTSGQVRALWRDPGVDPLRVPRDEIPTLPRL